MKTFYLTFGQKYAREPHPNWVNSAKQFIHPDGWWEVYAPDKEKARDAAFDCLGQYWAGLYLEKEFSPEHYPMGKIGELKYVAPVEYLVPKKTIDEAAEARDSIKKFLKEVILPKLSAEKRERVLAHVAKGMDIDAAMATEKVKITVN